ncbi:probable phosphoribosyltransferase (homolog to anthranilate phosphoribosyltransferase) [Natronomonas pharaonis DSM 2160]|uniref:Probable phosphoribosyltransferase (Homolog to anthranilate phosphoribosyltransferase) n=1 Tax=Natronomonas pharaonis (strain ATCC 35678 / DSM 2160 / CIP 103997 / JCM 8858 / NBRC 14720 / NCIMB 2260 / Gabara) TaxID=348780 RepID=A0A1U7ETU9_NATPD|nr:anthranilate phosphoribosyltransferase [Natronomonas pharaonis]CAI48357.1 probable phosphoribosyltransferase (homolog to anthranilate phosphoribosyltransferase) [Natronomonas pharaonis DSM 2160]
MLTEKQEFGDWPLKRLMTEVVGTGIKSAEDMSREQATDAFRRIVAGEPDETTLGAFWLANRWKRNTPEELAAFLDVMLESVERAEPKADPVDCGANYDGKAETAILGVAAGAVAAGAGTPVVVHGGDRIPSQKSPAYKDVLDELGVTTELDPEESAAMVDETGFGFYFQPAFNPAIDDLYDRRDEMGVRTFVNTIETLANPAGASVHLGSFYHLTFAEKVIDTIRAAERSRFDRAILFQGMEGYDDIRPGYTKVAEWADDGALDDVMNDYEIETAELGMDFEYDDLAVDDIAADSAAITEAVLTGERTDQFRDAVLLNGAFRIYAGGDADSFEAGLDAAERALDDGSAAAVLTDLQSF